MLVKAQTPSNSLAASAALLLHAAALASGAAPRRPDLFSSTHTSCMATETRSALLGVGARAAVCCAGSLPPGANSRELGGSLCASCRSASRQATSAGCTATPYTPASTSSTCSAASALARRALAAASFSRELEAAPASCAACGSRELVLQVLLLLLQSGGVCSSVTESIMLLKSSLVLCFA